MAKCRVAVMTIYNYNLKIIKRERTSKVFLEQDGKVLLDGNPSIVINQTCLQLQLDPRIGIRKKTQNAIQPLFEISSLVELGSFKNMLKQNKGEILKVEGLLQKKQLDWVLMLILFVLKLLKNKKKETNEVDLRETYQIRGMDLSTMWYKRRILS